MYETYEELLERKLDLISDKRDKRQGSLIYDAMAPNAAETAAFYADLALLENRTFADTACGIDLERRCEERGIYRKEAAKATFYGSFLDGKGNHYAVAVGSRFAYEGWYYQVVAVDACGRYILACEMEGEVGNYYLGEILPLTYMEGLAEAFLLELRTSGEDAEGDEELRGRYRDSFEAEAFGGNVADYKQKVMALQEVGGVKVYPVWSGGGTVRIVVIDRGWRRPTGVELESLQNAIDPQKQGLGYGIAPIGHQVTVAGVEETECRILLKVITEEGYEVDESMLEEMSQTLEAYFVSLRKEWASGTQLVIRTSYIEARILELTGVLDVEWCAINAESKNWILGADQIPILSGIEVR